MRTAPRSGRAVTSNATSASASATTRAATRRLPARSQSLQPTVDGHPYGFLPHPPEIERRKSRINGWGVFALQTIRKNTRIIHYAGEKISNQVSLKREARYIKDGHIWCFKLTNRTVIDAGVGGNDARFINHACRPNCYVHILGGTIWIRAARTIRPSVPPASGGFIATSSRPGTTSARRPCPPRHRSAARGTCPDRAAAPCPIPRSGRSLRSKNRRT